MSVLEPQSYRLVNLERVRLVAGLTRDELERRSGVPARTIKSQEDRSSVGCEHRRVGAASRGRGSAARRGATEGERLKGFGERANANVQRMKKEVKPARRKIAKKPSVASASRSSTVKAAPVKRTKKILEKPPKINARNVARTPATYV